MTTEQPNPCRHSAFTYRRPQTVHRHSKTSRWMQHDRTMAKYSIRVVAENWNGIPKRVLWWGSLPHEALDSGGRDASVMKSG